MMVGSAAAIMSTADSVLIAITHIITLDVLRPFCQPAAQAGEEAADMSGTTKDTGAARTTSAIGAVKKLVSLKWLSKLVSVVLVVACIPAAVVSANLSSMMQFQSLFLAQLFPLFVLGLYIPAR